jgi:hypothetical protein
MAVFSPTLASVEQEVYLRLGGMSQVQENVGRLAVRAAINSAQVDVLIDCPHAFVAGSCFSVETLNGNNGAHPLPSGVLAVLGVGISSGFTKRIFDLDTFLKLPTAALPGLVGEVGYYVTSTDILARPYQNAVSAYLVKVPAILEGDDDVVSLGALGYAALCAKATLNVAGQWRDFPTDKIAFLQADYRTQISNLYAILGGQRLTQSEG